MVQLIILWLPKLLASHFSPHRLQWQQLIFPFNPDIHVVVLIQQLHQFWILGNILSVTKETNCIAKILRETKIKFQRLYNNCIIIVQYFVFVLYISSIMQVVKMNNNKYIFIDDYWRLWFMFFMQLKFYCFLFLLLKL